GCGGFDEPRTGADPSLAVGRAVGPGCAGTAPRPPPRRRAPASAEPRPGGTLTIALGSDVRSLDPAALFSFPGVGVAHLLYDTLVGYARADSPDPTALVPALAETWEVSEDGLSYHFTLRAGLAYSDGT